MANKKSPKVASFFECKNCDYITSKHSDYIKHNSTAKHKRLTMANKKSPKVAKFECDCGKVYAHASSLSKHTRKCGEYTIYNENIVQNIDTESDQNAYIGVINKLVNDNNELKQIMVEQTKELHNQNAEHKRETNDILTKVMEMNKPHTINNTINGNINNNRVNINMFLHNQCAGALNLTDFIDRIEVSQHDLENNANMGFVEGISKILVDNLKQLSVYERPIHCTDSKREIMYIKDQDTWQKDNNDGKLRDAIQEVSRKSMQVLVDWKEKNPDYDDLDSDFSNRCITIQKGSNAGTQRETLYPKVIKTLAKESTLDKNIVEI
jgi:hypothetical protein